MSKYNRTFMVELDRLFEYNLIARNIEIELANEGIYFETYQKFLVNCQCEFCKMYSWE